MEKSNLKEESIPLKSCIFISAADGACATLAGLASSAVLTYYFTRWRGLDTKLASIVWLIFGIWNAINDPLFGYISDRTKSKLGRRIPYIRYGAPFYIISFIACWIDWPGTNTNQTAMFIQMLALLFVFDALYTAIATAIYIMPYEMAVSNKARSKIYIWKIIFQAFSMSIPVILIPIIQPGPGDDATNFRIVMTVFGLIMGTIIFVSTYFYKENHYTQEEEQFGFFKSIRECFTNSSFIIFEVISITVMYVQTALIQGVLYYFDEIKVAAIPLYIALFVGIILGIIFWIKKQSSFGVKKCMTIMCFLFSIGCFIILVFGWTLYPAIVGFFLFGTGFAGAMYLVPIMNGDVIDMDENRTGLRREGMYAGVNSFITKPAISIAQAVFLSIITSYGYNQTLKKGLQSHTAQSGILIGWLLVPSMLLFICFIIMYWYPLHGEKWNEIKKNLEVKHKEKERKYLESHGYKFIE